MAKVNFLPSRVVLEQAARIIEANIAARNEVVEKATRFTKVKVVSRHYFVTNST